MLKTLTFMHNPGLFLSFLAGVLSILSPCILPILPSFIAYITGISLSKNYSDGERKTLRRKLIIETLLFGLGFSITFLLFGAVIGFVGENLLLNRPIFEKIAGIIIILFGLQLTGIIKITTLLKGKNFELLPVLKKVIYLRSFLMGILFSFSWAPCYGPIIGTIFTLAATKANFSDAILLFVFYSFGFMTPLILISVFISNATTFLKKFKRITPYVSLFSGFFVIILGILLLTNNLNFLVNFLSITYNKLNFPFL